MPKHRYKWTSSTFEGQLTATVFASELVEAVEHALTLLEVGDSKVTIRWESVEEVLDY